MPEDLGTTSNRGGRDEEKVCAKRRRCHTPHRPQPPISAPRFDYRRTRRDCVRLGTEYGGWWFDPSLPLDGGLVVSASAGEDISFDIAIASTCGVDVLIVDPTPRAVAHVEAVLSRPRKPATTPFVDGDQQPVEAYDLEHVRSGQVILAAVALWSEDRELSFHPPLDPEHVSHSVEDWRRTPSDTSPPPITVPGRRLSTLLDPDDLTRLAILKLDIEEAEVEVLDDILSEGICPPQILVEFDQLQNPTAASRARVRQALGQLDSAGYRLIRREGLNYSFVRTLVTQRPGTGSHGG